jgi:mannose-6-phosphate isomerase-like protein (cupin superfamily)
MKREIGVGLICLVVGFLGHYAMNLRTVAAQEQEAKSDRMGSMLVDRPAEARIEDGKAYVISMDDVKKKFPPADKTGKIAPSNLSRNLGWDPVYTLVVMQRPYLDPPVTSRNTGALTHWSDAEMHEEKAQLYLIVSGTGQMALGGKAPMEHKPIITGQHGGGPLGPTEGATLQRVKAGDMVVIPPFAWHQIMADPGQTFTYIKVDILTPRLMP